MKKIFGEKGFTLIELLMVVAIIGILAAITMGYLGQAKQRGADAAVKSNLVTIRAVSEIYYLDNNNSYLPPGGAAYGIALCPAYDPAGTNMLAADKIIAAAIAEAIFRGDGTSACYNGPESWAVAVGLKEVPNTSWCIDTSGVSKGEAMAAGEAIDPATFGCK